MDVTRSDRRATALKRGKSTLTGRRERERRRYPKMYSRKRAEEVKQNTFTNGTNVPATVSYPVIVEEKIDVDEMEPDSTLISNPLAWKEEIFSDEEEVEPPLTLFLCPAKEEDDDVDSPGDDPLALSNEQTDGNILQDRKECVLYESVKIRKEKNDCNVEQRITEESVMSSEIKEEQLHANVDNEVNRDYPTNTCNLRSSETSNRSVSSVTSKKGQMLPGNTYQISAAVQSKVQNLMPPVTSSIKEQASRRFSFILPSSKQVKSLDHRHMNLSSSIKVPEQGVNFRVTSSTCARQIPLSGALTALPTSKYQISTAVQEKVQNGMPPAIFFCSKQQVRYHPPRVNVPAILKQDSIKNKLSKNNKQAISNKPEDRRKPIMTFDVESGKEVKCYPGAKVRNLRTACTPDHDYSLLSSSEREVDGERVVCFNIKEVKVKDTQTIK